MLHKKVSQEKSKEKSKGCYTRRLAKKKVKEKVLHKKVSQEMISIFLVCMKMWEVKKN